MTITLGSMPAGPTGFGATGFGATGFGATGFSTATNSTARNSAVTQGRRIRSSGRDEVEAPSAGQLLLTLLQGRRRGSTGWPNNTPSTASAERPPSAGPSILGNSCGCAYC